MPFNHVGIPVPSRHFDATVQFYLAALAPLGYTELIRPVPDVVGIGPEGKPELWFSKDRTTMTTHEGDDNDDDGTSMKLHIALDAASKLTLPLRLSKPFHFIYPGHQPRPKRVRKNELMELE